MTSNGACDCHNALLRVEAQRLTVFIYLRLTYWVVFGFFNFIESFIDIILHFIPMYYTFKTLAIVWLMLPQTQGAKVVYTRVLRPVMANARGQGSTPAAPSAAAHSAHTD